MSPKLKRTVSFLFIVLCMAAVFYIAFSNTDLKDAWEAIKQMKIGWLAAIFLCWIVYTFFDGMNYWYYLKGQGFKISIGRAVNIALIGFYYSNITPGAAGGQPMQVCLSAAWRSDLVCPHRVADQLRRGSAGASCCF